ncbi:MAG: transaldolase [Gammaproteobacteria bacterium]|nr:transaldolase [Gammaproteobacteria bacterium]
MKNISDLCVKIFADGADKNGILTMYTKKFIKGFTTNPTLMHKAGVQHYETFAKEILANIQNLPISFEVFSDDFSEMRRQALKISSWGDNVFVKIPITNTKGDSAESLIKELAKSGIKQNVTALMTLEQVTCAAQALANGPSAFISVFAGRIADTGRDPMPIMAEAVKIMAKHQQLELIWASCRELLNIYQANTVGCHIITVTNDIINKFGNIGRDLKDFSLDTVKMFHTDAAKSGFNL